MRTTYEILVDDQPYAVITAQDAAEAKATLRDTDNIALERMRAIILKEEASDD